MSLKTIVVLIDFAPKDEARLRYAVRLALQHSAHLVGLYVSQPILGGDAAESYVRGLNAMRTLIRKENELLAERRETASEEFSSATAKEDIGFEFRVIAEGNAEEQTRLNSLHADLIVVGYPQPGGLPWGWSAETLLIATGVPFLIVPDNWHGTSVAERPMIGWNASREARRAMTDNMAIIQAASSVTIALVDWEANPLYGEDPGSDVALFLSRHGATVEVMRLESHGRKVADTLKAAAGETGSDLLVVGAFSHSRSREIVFGGVTRDLLANVTIPLLVAH